MSNVKTQLSLFGFALACSLLAGCAWDNSPPPFHTVIHYDPSRAQSYVSNVAPANAPSTRDWKTNQVVGADYGSTGQNAPATSGQAVGGAASTPSGVSSGISAPPPATGLNSTTPFSTSTSPQYQGSSLGLTNSASGLLFTNRYTAPTNSLLNPALNVPRP